MHGLVCLIFCLQNNWYSLFLKEKHITCVVNGKTPKQWLLSGYLCLIINVSEDWSLQLGIVAKINSHNSLYAEFMQILFDILCKIDCNLDIEGKINDILESIRCRNFQPTTLRKTRNNVKSSIAPLMNFIVNPSLYLQSSQPCDVGVRWQSMSDQCSIISRCRLLDMINLLKNAPDGAFFFVTKDEPTPDLLIKHGELYFGS